MAEYPGGEDTSTQKVICLIAWIQFYVYLWSPQMVDLWAKILKNMFEKSSKLWHIIIPSAQQYLDKSGSSEGIFFLNICFGSGPVIAILLYIHF